MSEPARGRVSHFEDMEQQAHAAHLGMWVFLASELLLFSALFALYAAYRVMYPVAFGLGVAHAARGFGTLNTAVLICSSFAAASAVHAVRAGHARRAAGLLTLTLFCGALFLGIKSLEYAEHFREGIFPGGSGLYFQTNLESGLAAFYTIYYLMTGLHGIHVLVGIAVLTWVLIRTLKGSFAPPFTHPFELGVLYWHLIDAIWIFLWPLFYLLPGPA